VKALREISKARLSLIGVERYVERRTDRRDLKIEKDDKRRGIQK
jgi:hypothetical protein